MLGLIDRGVSTIKPSSIKSSSQLQFRCKLNMKSFIILALVAVAAADVSHIVRSPEADAQVVQQDADVFPDQYKFSYQTSNGIAAQESAVLKVNGQEAGFEVSGSNGYTAPDGQRIETSYTADANGYHPQGAHLPTPPAPLPIPDYILRSIAYIQAHPPQEQKYVTRA